MMADATPRQVAIDIKVGETLTLTSAGGVDSPEITLTLLQKSGQRARFLVKAPDAVRIKQPPKRAG